MNLRPFLFVTVLSVLLSHASLADWKKLLDAGMSVNGRFLSFGNVIIAASDSGINRSTDSGVSWFFFGIDTIHHPIYGAITIIPTRFARNDKFIFAATNAGVYASEDTGRTWKSLGPSPDGKSLSMMCVFTAGPIVFTTMMGGGVFRSSDHGASWTYLGPHRFYNYLEYHTTFFAAAMDGLWFSADAGQTWDLCKDFNIYPAYISTFSLASTDEYLFVDAWETIYRSGDAGSTFQKVAADLPFHRYNILGLYTVNNIIFAGLTNNRIYLSLDSGEHWRDVTGGLDTNGMVNCYGLSGERILVSKNGCLWSHELSTLTRISVEGKTNPARFSLSQNYPNPFNPSTTIEYSLPTHTDVRLTIFDLLGRTVVTLVNEAKPAGLHTISFDASTLPGGLYFYRLQTEEYSQTKKLLLIK